MNRRAWLLAGTSVAAGAAGAGWQYWRRRASESDALWQQRFPTPDGGELVMAALRGRPLLVNFWATWCAPCVKEMPDLDRFYRANASRGWQVVGIAVDSPAPVREFLQRSPVAFAIGVAGFEGSELSRMLGNLDGALPFTALIDAQGRIARRKLGASQFSELATWAQAL